MGFPLWICVGRSVRPVLVETADMTRTLLYSGRLVGARACGGGKAPRAPARNLLSVAFVSPPWEPLPQRWTDARASKERERLHSLYSKVAVEIETKMRPHLLMDQFCLANGRQEISQPVESLFVEWALSVRTFAS